MVFNVFLFGTQVWEHVQRIKDVRSYHYIKYSNNNIVVNVGITCSGWLVERCTIIIFVLLHFTTICNSSYVRVYEDIIYMDRATRRERIRCKSIYYHYDDDEYIIVWVYIDIMMFTTVAHGAAQESVHRMPFKYAWPHLQQQQHQQRPSKKKKQKIIVKRARSA